MKASASEILASYPLLRRFSELFVERRDGDPLNVEHRSLRAACRVLDVMQAYKFNRIPASMVQPVVEDYFKATKLAYGRKIVRPKHHIMMHLEDQELLDCFPTERKNKLPKSHARWIHRTADTYERTVATKTLLFHWGMGLRVTCWIFPRPHTTLGVWQANLSGRATLTLLMTLCGRACVLARSSLVIVLVSY
jgi:hypothetical protein